jgi:hypothetical protein
MSQYLNEYVNNALYGFDEGPAKFTSVDFSESKDGEPIALFTATINCRVKSASNPKEDAEAIPEEQVQFQMYVGPVAEGVDDRGKRNRRELEKWLGVRLDKDLQAQDVLLRLVSDEGDLRQLVGERSFYLKASVKDPAVYFNLHVITDKPKSMSARDAKDFLDAFVAKKTATPF